MQSKAEMSMTELQELGACHGKNKSKMMSHGRVVRFFFYFKRTETFKIIKTEKVLESL